MTSFELPKTSLAVLEDNIERSQRKIGFVFHPSAPNTSFADQLLSAAQAIHRGTNGRVTLEHDEVNGPLASPALSVVCDERQVAQYLAVPEGSETKPFVDLLLALAVGESGGTHHQLLSGVTHECQLLVFVTPGCPNCPHAVATATTFAAASPHIEVIVVDATQFTTLAGTYNIQSVPTTVIDGGMTLIGVVPPKKLAKSISSRSQPEHNEEIFASLIAAGRFDEAAQRMLAGDATTAFTNLWSRSSLETRIGLAMAADSALEQQARGLDAIGTQLLGALASENPAIRGDTADLLGKIGIPDARGALEKLLDDSDEDVREAAADALEMLGTNS